MNEIDELLTGMIPALCIASFFMGLILMVRLIFGGRKKGKDENA